MTDYRAHAAKGTIETLRKLGILLLVDGGNLVARPRGRIRKYPGLIAMCARYTKEIAQELDSHVS